MSRPFHIGSQDEGKKVPLHPIAKHPVPVVSEYQHRKKAMRWRLMRGSRYVPSTLTAHLVTLLGMQKEALLPPPCFHGSPARTHLTHSPCFTPIFRDNSKRTEKKPRSEFWWHQNCLPVLQARQLSIAELHNSAHVRDQMPTQWCKGMTEPNERTRKRKRKSTGYMRGERNG